MKKQIDFSEWLDSTQFFGGNVVYLESLYDEYIKGNTANISPEWLSFFESINQSTDTVHSDLVEEFRDLAKNKVHTNIVVQESTQDNIAQVTALAKAYRLYAYKSADIDPLGLIKVKSDEELNPSFHNLKEADFNKTFNLGALTNNTSMPLSEIINKLKKVYESKIAYEYMYIANKEEKTWLKNKIESMPELDKVTKQWILKELISAEGLEKYLALRYVGQKRFGLEGGESTIPSLQYIIEKAVAKHSTKFVQIGMAHRGRLNVLVNILGKNPADLFAEFEGRQSEKSLSGDVKYHMGYSNYREIEGNKAKIALAFNPSHLEAVDPVVEGAVKAIQNKVPENAKTKVLPILIHGDSAFCGQGVVMETFGFSQTEHYGTGGTIHLVINNQVGFTTSSTFGVNRSSTHATDIAKMVDAPIIHINGDDPESVIKATEVALEYRMKFNKDVVIDIFCYRKNGHNETDEPSGTQPLLYSIIKKHPSTLSLYSKKIEEEGILSKAEIKKLNDSYRAKLDNGIATIETLDSKVEDWFKVCDWRPYIEYMNKFKHKKKEYHAEVISVDTLEKLALNLAITPDNLKMQNQVKKAVLDRVKMAKQEIPLNWGFAETLAYATLLNQGHDVRISGEDSGRGTFSHRHAVLKNTDINSDLKEYIPLKHINEDVRFDVIDSTLSEYGVLGFEYGYSCYNPNGLTIWEAQFGDFVNTAQVVIDQFLVSAEEKWGILSGLTLLLPHGQEGAGAEHSSARLERFLNSCANGNMQVCTPTTPAQIYHLLRRQVLRPLRRPLIVMSPKSLLRNPKAVSTMQDLSKGTFQTIIVDSVENAEKVNKVILCNGKVYYDLMAKIESENIKNVAVIRIEELYPFPKDEMEEAMSKYSNATDIIWLQEEPENKGAWYNILHFLNKILKDEQKLRYVGRGRSSTPAVGYHALYTKQQEEVICKALDL